MKMMRTCVLKLYHLYQQTSKEKTSEHFISVKPFIYVALFGKVKSAPFNLSHIFFELNLIK